MNRISAKFKTTDWPKELSDSHSNKWPVGVEIVRDRFESRFLKPIQTLVDHEDIQIRYNSGFVIMSIDCLFIETLNQFYLGISTTNEKYNYSIKDNNFRKNWQAFRDFFRYSNYFPLLKADEELIRLFYEEIRCGLLHQAESKSQSLINVKEREMICLNQAGDCKKGLVVNRNIFHDALKNEFNKYLSDLANPNSVNLFGENLRNKCDRKMRFICS
jgi:hypothetical protein